ncbi:uncharacterized protein LOC116263398 [Nymphaea colorata]|nr:uncharacterized protein LOC116263398 [Nymphaea colorata]XP_031499008.1 uncharacterized protein LOC116263398 [Nymphaea colorata]XP_031499018.1 uncharacterized protein LOC116263398 [Nymphaea colorata]
MDDNVESSVVSEKPQPSAKTLDVVTLYTDSPRASGNDALRLENVTKISRRIRSSLARSFSAKNRTSSNGSGSGGGHENRGLKNSPSLSEGSHVEGPGISSGNLDGLNNGAGLLKKKRGLLKRKHAKNSWVSGGNCGISGIGFSETVKGKKVSWIRKVGFSSALKNEGVDLGRSKKRKGRKEISLSSFEPVLKKRKNGSNGGFCFSSTGPTLKKSRSRVGVAKKHAGSGTVDDLKNLDQISDASKSVAVTNGSAKNDCVDSALEKLHLEDGTALSCRSHGSKPIDSSIPKDCSSSVASRNHSKGRLVNSKDESRPLIDSLLNKRRKILKKIKKEESSRCASVLSLDDNGVGSVPKKMMSRSIRKRRTSDGTSHVELKALDGNISENDKEASCLGSNHAEPSSQVDINVTEKDVQHSFMVSQDRADECSDRILPIDIKEQEPENSLSIVAEPPHANCEKLSSIDADVQRVDKNVNKVSQENLDLRPECVEDSSNLSLSQADEQENLEQNAAQMLSSRFNSSCNNFVGDDSHLVQYSANRSLFSMLFHGTGANSLVRGKVPGADAPARVLRPRKQKQKHFIRRRRRFVDVRYRESDAYWVLSRKVKVFWPLDKQWYFGEIKSYNPKTKLHYIQYDDRDEEWLSLGKERFKLLLHEGELDDHAGCSYDSRYLEREHVNVEQEFHSPVDESTGSFLDSEPIISWLARSSSRASLSSLGTVKMQKKASASGNDVATCIFSEDSIFAKKTEQPAFMLRRNENDKLVPGFASGDASVPLQVNEAAHRDEDKKHDPVQFDLISNKRKAPVVYFRKRFRRRKECLPHVMEEPSSGSVLGSVSFLASVADKVRTLEDLEPPVSDKAVKPHSCESRSLASKSLSLTMPNLEHASAGFGTLLVSTGNTLHQGNSALKVEHCMTSQFTSSLVKLDHVRLILCIPSQWVFSPKAIAKDMEFLNALQLVNFGEINPVWPKVHLEMMIIDKVVTLNILLFEGCLGHAVTLLCSILFSLCTSQVSTDSYSSTEIRSDTDVQFPYISVRFKLLGDEGKQAGFVLYIPLKTETSSCQGVHASDDKLSLPSESLPSVQPAVVDVRFLQSMDSPEDSLAFEKMGKPQEFTYQHIYRSCYGVSMNSLPGISIDNIGNLSAISLSFAAAPTFFLSLHLKLMIESAIASSFLPNSSMEKNLGCNKRILIKGKDGLIIQPSSGVTNPQATGPQLLGPKHGVVVSDAPPSIASTGHWLKCDQQPSDRKLNAAGIHVGVAGLKRDHPFDDAHCRTVIRLRRYPCNMGSWQYAGRSRPSASTVPPLSAVDDQIGFPSSQVRPLPFERAAGNARNPGNELVGNVQEGNFRHPSATAPRSMSNNNRIKSARKSFSCRSKSWQEGRSGVLYNEFFGRSWKNQNLVSGSSPSDDRGPYRHGRVLKQENDDDLRRSLGNSLSPHRFLDSLSCGANILVTVGDRGWRECGAQVMLASVDHNDWRLLVKIEGSTRYSYKAHQLLQPGVTNRSNHAIIWKGGKDWSLEFVNRNDYALFKEMHEECYNRNIRAASVKNIPIPGVRRIDDDEASYSAVPFVRGARYFRQLESEIEMALNSSRVLYDMDNEDEEWLMQFRKSLDIDESQVVDVSDEMYERAMDAFEKVAYGQQCEEFSCDQVEHITSGIGPFDIMDAIYEHWRMKRRQKRTPLIRQFQPPLWEQYQRQLKEWESAMAKLQNSSDGCTGKGGLIEKPPMFAFCLRPRGLEVPNKGSKQRSHKKFPAVGFSNAYPRELESCPFNGRRMNGSTVGDERAVNSYSSYDYSDVSPRVQSYSGLSPKYTSPSGPSTRNSDWLDFNQSPRAHHINNSKKMGAFVPSTGYASGSISRRNGVLHLQRPAPSKWPRKKHYQSDGSSMEQSSDQSGSTDHEEIRLRDPVAAAQHASELARLKRMKAQRLLQRADLALHKAMVALVTADLIQAAENESAGGE